MFCQHQCGSRVALLRNNSVTVTPGVFCPVRTAPQRQLLAVLPSVRLSSVQFGIFVCIFKPVCVDLGLFVCYNFHSSPTRSRSTATAVFRQQQQQHKRHFTMAHYRMNPKNKTSPGFKKFGLQTRLQSPTNFTAERIPLANKLLLVLR